MLVLTECNNEDTNCTKRDRKCLKTKNDDFFMVLESREKRKETNNLTICNQNNKELK
jgi:hypothetical protein